jgi:hypothetical protein
VNAQALRARLSSYWKLEVLNAALLPGFMIFACLSTDQEIGVGLVLACLPMCGLLLLGGFYWRAKLHQLDGRRDTLDRVLRQARHWQAPLLATSVMAALLAIASWLLPELAASKGERWAISAAAALAALEYINYNHRQLQHFDHPADFRRLITGRGFQPSQLAKDMRRRKP